VYLPIILAERFGGTPFAYEDIGVDRLERLVALLSIEGQVARDWEGLGSGDSVYRPEGWELDD
jgi:hypothetical protein